ncbi:hypothetical protein EYF80_045166 [Liparis tanakae]|uniref:Uncharacterized protein n=1 Tax=Liparis tanakae TaxID=230148 RepID=A0A4Z2FV01_9TELE|nr:hypothetical protein EYF80_045166 [Liparis tanakae]
MCMTRSGSYLCHWFWFGNDGFSLLHDGGFNCRGLFRWTLNNGGFFRWTLNNGGFFRWTLNNGGFFRGRTHCNGRSPFDWRVGRMLFFKDSPLGLLQEGKDTLGFMIIV